MAIALVNHVGLFGATTPLNITTGTVNMTGASLLVFIASCSTATTTFAVSDSSGNTWTALSKLTSAGAGNDLQMFYAVNPTVSATQTFSLTVNGSAHFPTILVLGFSGTLTTAGVFDAQAVHLTPATTTTAQPGSITPAVAGEVFVTGAMDNNGNITLSINSSFNITDSGISGTKEVGGAAYLINSGTAAQNPTWTFTGNSAASGINAVMAAFKPAIATNHNFLMMMGCGT